jgi:hypothetical protein
MNHDKHNRAVIEDAKRHMEKHKASEAAKHSVRVGGKRGGCLTIILMLCLIIMLVVCSCYPEDTGHWPNKPDQDDQWKVAAVAAIIIIGICAFAVLPRRDDEPTHGKP